MKERLAYILMKTYWEGVVSRQDVMKRFNVSAAQASKNFSELRKVYPNTIKYDDSIKRYVPDFNLEQTIPSLDFQYYLNLIKQQFNRPINVLPSKPYIPVKLYRVLNNALNKKSGIGFKYHSLANPTKNSPRTVFPHSLVNSGYRWHIRGWEKESGLFKDFNLSRIEMGTLKLLEITDIHSDMQNDAAWNNEVSIFLIPNPKLSEGEGGVVALDFNMRDKILHLRCKQALLIYTLNSYLVTDFSESPSRRQLLAIGNINSVKKYLPSNQ
jgi:predicted DNA-binding transcriptional regulator YafY